MKLSKGNKKWLFFALQRGFRIKERNLFCPFEQAFSCNGCLYSQKECPKIVANADLNIIKLFLKEYPLLPYCGVSIE